MTEPLNPAPNQETPNPPRPGPSSMFSPEVGTRAAETVRHNTNVAMEQARETSRESARRLGLPDSSPSRPMLAVAFCIVLLVGLVLALELPGRVFRGLLER